MTTETTTRTEISEAMTAIDLRQACQELRDILGGNSARVSCIVASDSYNNKTPVALLVYPPRDNSGHILHGKSWPETFAAATAWAKTKTQINRNNIVKRMALKIIDLTDELGSCTEARLRAADFTHDEIVEFHEAACARAGEMAGNVPFVVVMEPL